MIDGLRARGLTVRFGGLVAVDDVSLAAPAGRVTGLIGPNGAGKTTIFNACTGLVRPASGTVELFGHDVTRRSPAHRAQRGLGRTFQRMELFDSLSVLDNVRLGREAAYAGRGLLRHVMASSSELTETADAADGALALCGLLPLRQRRAGSLSTGQRRLVELARVLAGPFRLLLLDEPSSGLDAAETERFGAVLRAAVEQRGIGVLVVEHDMALVTSVCDAAYVLDFGQLVFEGGIDAMLASPVVRDAYLGAADAELEARSR